MCHLVSWRHIPKSDAERATIQTLEFRDDSEAVPPMIGADAAIAKAEALVSEGAKEVKLWKLAGVPTSQTVIQWETPNAE